MRFTGIDVGEVLSVESGDLVMQGIGRIDGNGITDLFMEFNAVISLAISLIYPFP